MKILNQLFGDIYFNGKTNIFRRRNSCINPDNLAGTINQWATGISRINCRIGLN